MGVVESKQDVSIKDLVLGIVNNEEPESIISNWCLYEVYDKDTIYDVLTVLMNDRTQRKRIGVDESRLHPALTEKRYGGEKFKFYKYKGAYIRYSSYMSAKNSSQPD